MADKKKIITISDHALSTSGVGTQMRFLINGLLNTGKYTFRSLGAAMKHDNYESVSPHPDWIIKPIDGFGDQNTIRQLLVSEKPDALLLFTDPRFFSHIWTMEEEIHQVCPIVYNTIWDAPPTPAYNRYVYDSCDLLNCINDVSYSFLKEWYPDKTHYVPHAVPSELYFPVPENQARDFKRQLIGQQRVDHFTLLFVSRNARRKQVPDILVAFKLFLDRLEREHGHRNATFLLHCDPLDHEGSNLYAVIEMLGLVQNVVFSRDRVPFDNMRNLYNACDVLVNCSSAEGFGLPVLEMKMCGKPIIAIKAGGLTKQVEDEETGEQYGVALEPDVKVLSGTQMIPYIYDYFVSHEKLADAYMKVYEMSGDDRKALGERARQHALTRYSMDAMTKKWDETLTDTILNWRTRHKRWVAKEM